VGETIERGNEKRKVRKPPPCHRAWTQTWGKKKRQEQKEIRGGGNVYQVIFKTGEEILNCERRFMGGVRQRRNAATALHGGAQRLREGGGLITSNSLPKIEGGLLLTKVLKRV